MVLFGMGCFWGAERKFWRQKGVYSTQVGYSGGYTPNPTYEEEEQDTQKWSAWSLSLKKSTLLISSRCSGKAMIPHKMLTEAGFGVITTEISMVKEFYYAEDYHQQYLSKNPDGYCGLNGTGVSCPIGLKIKN
ncbi:hypothetical protein DNTS_000649 [Danionella cerebrum]|uniref:peptide-methionine (S)-S-oxide reductase n=1 Tax=Danionella cerebrum TaxID=2873325 RepID=A0A553QAK5_9TELE|nr:hypothetical protein DNTS_000649 [Danionella translucida]